MYDYSNAFYSDFFIRQINEIKSESTDYPVDKNEHHHNRFIQGNRQ